MRNIKIYEKVETATNNVPAIDQFKLKLIKRLYNNYYDLSISNSTILVIISIITIIYILKPSTTIISRSKTHKGKLSYIFTISYEKINNLVKDILGDTKYLPLIISIFYFILLNNLFGLFPYSFTTTSHFIFNLFLSLSIIIGTTLLGLSIHKIKFFNLFVPSGLSTGPQRFLLPLIILIEIISYISRIISLSVRLTANMLSGHILLALISSFGYVFVLNFPYLFFVPITILLPFFILELAIAFIQTYVFTLLTTSYIKDVVNLH